MNTVLCNSVHVMGIFEKRARWGHRLVQQVTRALIVSFLSLMPLVDRAGAGELSLENLAALSGEELSGIDIGALNLMCAEGLDGANNIDLPGYCRVLDYMSRCVWQETQRHFPKYYENPAEFQDMEGFYRMQVLVMVVQRDFNMHYNPARDSPADDPEAFEDFFADSRDLFIHGFVERQMGTCASFPVLYTAIARRLGYPVYLVATRLHLFCRWESDDGNERFNIEGTNHGMVSHPDSHYRNWPKQVSQEQIEANGWLKNHTPREELSSFLSTRAICLRANGRMEEAAKAYDLAYQLAPHIELTKLQVELFGSRK